MVIEQATQRAIQTIVIGYSDMLNKAKAIVGSTTPSFYSITTQPGMGSLIAKRDFLILALSIALGGVLAIIAALLWPKRQTD